MSAHTPGPWSVYEDACKVAAHGAKNLVRSSSLGDYFTESLTDDKGEFFNHADAQLCSAAPELLDACKAARAMTPDGTYTASLLDAAIAKAEGR